MNQNHDPHELDGLADFGTEHAAGCAMALLGAIAAAVIILITFIVYMR